MSSVPPRPLITHLAWPFVFVPALKRAALRNTFRYLLGHVLQPPSSGTLAPRGQVEVTLIGSFCLCSRLSSLESAYSLRAASLIVTYRARQCFASLSLFYLLQVVYGGLERLQ
jgi:hypothetical protein